jgi:hypothetical protein
VSRHFITGAAQSVTNSVERITALRKAHPEWDEALTPKAAARDIDKVSECSACESDIWSFRSAEVVSRRCPVTGPSDDLTGFLPVRGLARSLRIEPRKAARQPVRHGFTLT